MYAFYLNSEEVHCLQSPLCMDSRDTNLDWIEREPVRMCEIPFGRPDVSIALLPSFKLVVGFTINS
jgi:hypothetical protein